MGLTHTTLTATGSVLVAAGPVILTGLFVSTTGDTCTLAAHNCATTGDVVAGNLIFQLVLNPMEPNIINFDGSMFPAGLVVKATLGAVGPVDLNIEWE